MSRNKNIKYYKITDEGIKKLEKVIDQRIEASAKRAQEIAKKWHLPRKIMNEYDKINKGFRNNEDQRLRGYVVNPNYIGSYYRQHLKTKTLKMMKSTKNYALGLLSQKEKNNTADWMRSFGFGDELRRQWGMEIEKMKLRKELENLRAKIREKAREKGLWDGLES